MKIILFIVNLNYSSMEKIKNFAKHFWHGVLLSLKGIVGIAAVALFGAFLLLFAAFLASGGVAVCSSFGNWAGAVYIVNVLLILYFFMVVKRMEREDGDSIWLTVGKKVVIFVLGVFVLSLANGLLWCVGRLVLIVLGQTCSVGLTMCIGILVWIVAFFIWILVEYIKEKGKKSFFNLLIKIGGFLTIPIIILILYFVLF